MEKLVFRRFAAFCIDYIIIAVFMLLLFWISQILNLKDLILTPISGQFLSFFSLTLPVFLYFFLSEKSKNRATIGKKIMNISICSYSSNKKLRIFQRNILKFLPWEIAHTGVHWIVFYSKHENNTPLWVLFLLILPQIILMFYVFTIITSRGESSIYDQIANSKIKTTIK